MKNYLMTIAAFFCCVTTVAVFTACTEDDLSGAGAATMM
jgi:hypothetical protein